MTSGYGPRMRRVLSAFLVVALAGCLWRSYGDILTVHVTVLIQMVDKLSALAEAGRTPAAADMAEFNYPAQRGRTFLRQFERDAGRESYRAFAALLDRYQALLRQVDAARVSEADWRALRPALAQEQRALAEQAAAIGRHREQERRQQ
ncbi:MAG: hypothetical protein HY699_20270 [Deltaproteobacteria bacterium]|nr:hypothetical protein [Deltaproteobacteria bacterium]